MARFEGYEEKKGFWFWMMLTAGSLVSEDPSLSARKSDLLVDDFLISEFYTWIFKDRAAPTKYFKIMR